MASRQLKVDIVGDSRSLERAFDRSERAAKRFHRAMVGTAAAIGVSFGAQQVVQTLKSFVDHASDLNEQMSKTTVVFGKSAAGITAWSRTTAAAMGLSERQALATASSFGAMFAPLGIVGDEAANQSKRLTQLGADLASFYNTDVQDALDAIRSGLVGESEPLRRYGVLLSETRVQAEAMAETGKKAAASLTAQEKVAARIALIMRDASQAQGDFARTSGGLANQQRILTAQLDDLKTALGEALLPAVTDVTSAMNDWLADPENKQKTIDGFTTAVAKLGAAFQFAAATAGALKGAWDKLPDFGKNKGLLEILDKYIPTIEGPGFSLFAGSGGGKKSYPGLGKAAAAGQAAIEAARQGDRGFGGGAAGTSGAGTAGQSAREIAKLQQQAAERRNTWFDQMVGRLLGRAGDPTGLRGQIARYRVIAGLLTQRIAATKDVTRRLNLEDQLADVTVQIRDRQNQIAQNARAAAAAARKADAERTRLATERAKAAAKRAAERAKAAREAAAEARRQATQTRLGWLDFGVEMAGATKTPADDRRALNAKTRFLQELIRHEGRTLELVSELWRTRQQIRDLNKKKAGDGDPLAGLMQVSSTRLARMLAAGTGLSPAGMRVLGANISGAEIRPLHIHNTVVLDGRELARSMNVHNARGSRRTAKQTSGFRGG